MCVRPVSLLSFQRSGGRRSEETLVTKGKTLVIKGKTLVTKGKTLVIKGKTLVNWVIEGKKGGSVKGSK